MKGAIVAKLKEYHFLNEIRSYDTSQLFQSAVYSFHVAECMKNLTHVRCAHGMYTVKTEVLSILK